MELSVFQSKLAQFLPDISFSWNEPLALHTSFRIGGPAEAVAFPNSSQQLAAILKVCNLLQVKPAILGAGTNVLAPDEGMKGLVICLKDCLNTMERRGENTVYAAAGVTLSRLATFAAGHGLSGLEFAHGIPGTVGGGIYMNAGAYGGEISAVCRSVEVMDREGNISVYSSEKMEFSYRHSRLENTDEIVIGGTFILVPGSSDEIRGKMKELQQKRLKSQPLNLPSAGSAFKRPVGGYAAALIDEAGLKGFQVGGAAISEKHAGFAVNLGGATAEDVKNLLAQVSQIVFEKSAIRLEPEIRIW